MNKLDLSVYAEKVWEVTMMDGTELHIKKPTQKQLIILNGYDVKLSKAKAFEDKIKALNEVTVVILNNNKEGKNYKVEDLEDMQMDILYAIYFGYGDFIKEVMSNPN